MVAIAVIVMSVVVAGILLAGIVIAGRSNARLRTSGRTVNGNAEHLSWMPATFVDGGGSSECSADSAGCDAGAADGGAS